MSGAARSRTGRALVVALLVCLAVVRGAVVPGAGAVARAREPLYLALGDSITFGFRELSTTPAPDYRDPGSFVGYPEDLGAALGFQVVNAACPGETSSSFIDPNAPSNGCEHFANGSPGFRAAFPLHVAYQGSQLAFAVHYLRAHPATRLVSLMIGANDLLACQATTADLCASGVPGVLQRVSGNVATILQNLRGAARYRGQLVVVSYYALSFATTVKAPSSLEEAILALNRTIVRAARPYRVSVANGFGAFDGAARLSGGDTCAAGLLTQLRGGGCGIHPSPAGQAVLALAVASVLHR